MTVLASRDRIGAVIAGLAALVLLLAACGSSAGSSQSPGRASDTATWAEQPSQAPNWIWPFPQIGTNGTNNIELGLLYLNLYTFGDNGNADVDEPRSVAQLPSWGADGKTVTITMKDDEWSNGQPVTASDVLFDINMFKAERTNDVNYVPGGFPDNVVSAQATSPSTLVLTLNQAYNQHWFLYNELSQVTPWPAAWDATGPGKPSDCASDVADCPAVYAYLHAQAKAESTYATSPLWTVVDGPWKLKSFNSDGNVSMVPNPKYSGRIKARLKQFNMLPFTTDAAEFNVLKSGKTLDVGYIPTQDVSQPHPAGASPLTPGPNPLSSHYTLAPWLLYEFNYIPYNFNGPQAAIVDQLYFRQAMQSLVDQQGILKSAAKGYGVPSLGPVPLVPKSSLVSSNEKTNLYPFSVAKAKSDLSDNGWSVKPSGTTTCTKPGTGPGECGAGVAAGTPLSFQMPYETGVQTVMTAMESLKSNASQVGIQITLRGETFDAILANYTSACGAPGTSACDWTMANWGAGWIYGPDYYPTGDTLFQTGSTSNSGSYSSPQLDKYIQQTVRSNNPAAFTEYEQYVAKELPVLYQPTFAFSMTEVADGLHGFTPQSPLGAIYPEQWSY
ncbi:MAG: ABC transporter substrate-binding protein [Candidatus Dormibacteraceae bacterium]